DHRQRRHRQRLDAGKNGLHFLLVGDAIVAIAERPELGDVGAGNEGLATSTAKHRYAQPIFPADLRAGLAELLVHAPGHGVARRPVEDHRRDLAIAAVAHLSIGHRTAPAVATANLPNQGRVRRLISLITALLSKSPSPCRTQASSTSAWISSSGSCCFPSSACASMRRTSLRCWVTRPSAENSPRIIFEPLMSMTCE